VFDLGTTDALSEASQFIQSIERIQSYKIGCIEEICLRKGLIDKKGIEKTVDSIKNTSGISVLR
jgi:glucose-1-phosphate thymidylyltransferase